MPVIVVKNDFPRIAAQLKAKGKLAERHAAEGMADRARRAAPVATGRLRGSIQARGNEVYTDVPYSRFVEYGTVYMSAEPFFYQVVEAERRSFELELLEGFK